MTDGGLSLGQRPSSSFDAQNPNMVHEQLQLQQQQQQGSLSNDHTGNLGYDENQHRAQLRGDPSTASRPIEIRNSGARERSSSESAIHTTGPLGVDVSDRAKDDARCMS